MEYPKGQEEVTGYLGVEIQQQGEPGASEEVLQSCSVPVFMAGQIPE